MFENQPSIPNQFVTTICGVSVFVKREDLLHPEVSGNKYRKLKYNLRAAQAARKNRIVTFGGAYSNHIAATAAAGRASGLRTTGVIRGEELGKRLSETLRENPTLSFAASCGMHLKFISRSEYRKKTTPEFQEGLKNTLGDFFLIPEGGTNDLAIKGCEEILSENDNQFDYICCAIGTGGTLSGLINAASENTRIIGFPALKENFLQQEINKYSRGSNWDLVRDYHFGGYAKVDQELIGFINEFRKKYRIQLDPIYTGKMMFGIFDLIQKGKFPANTRILAIHTGGLQGISGMNKRLEKMKLPQIHV